MSPDGRLVAFNRGVSGNTDVWLLDSQRGDLTQLTSSKEVENFAVFSPDGSRVVFHVDHSTSHDLVEKPVAGGREQPVLQGPEVKGPRDWSRDGRYILYRSTAPKTGFDLRALPTFGDRRPFPIVRTSANERDAQFSPDGRWIAYETDASGRSEVVVQPFAGSEPAPAPPQRISRDGGARSDGEPMGRRFSTLRWTGRYMQRPSEQAGLALSRSALPRRFLRRPLAAHGKA